MKRFVIVAAFIVTNLLTPAWSHAQATGQINGSVADSSGALLPGVTIEATNTATGAVRTAVSGSDGLYTIPLLPPGDYTRSEERRVGKECRSRWARGETKEALSQV